MHKSDDQKGIMLYQSGFKTWHSTESALLKVFNDILLANDCGNFVILMLLDLTAEFDTVEHSVLLHFRTGVVLDWFYSYLAVQTFCCDLKSSLMTWLLNATRVNSGPLSLFTSFGLFCCLSLLWGWLTNNKIVLMKRSYFLWSKWYLWPVLLFLDLWSPI